MWNSIIQAVRGALLSGLLICLWAVARVVLHEFFGLEVSAWMVSFLFVLGCVWLGWGVRQVWIYPRRLQRAEFLWNSGMHASDVVDALAGTDLASGELGHRIWLLRSKANLAMGFRNLAWLESEEAHLARVSFHLRPFLRWYLRSIPRRSTVFLDWMGRIWKWLAPAMPSLSWRLAIHYLQRDEPASRRKAWRLLLSAWSHAADDPVLLEDLMLALLEGLQEDGAGDPELAAAFEGVLDLLLHRHGAARTGWDRVPPAVYLLRNGRCHEVLALGQTLPPERRPEGLWVVCVAAHRGMGDPEGAWITAEQALVHQPDSFRLWMMREDLALDSRRHAEALEALKKAKVLLHDGGPAEQLREWHTRRAEYAYWIEKDSDEAVRHLDYLSADWEGRPPLRLLILLDQERYEEVNGEVAALLKQQPGDPDLLLIQAESLAGMEAWESLQVHLESAGEGAMSRADFWHLRGICRSHLGNLQGAREDLERCGHMEPGNLRYVLDAGHACADLGEWERSEYHWRHVLRHDERNEEALTQLAESRRSLHDIDGAKRLLRECLLHHPECESAQVMLGELDAN